MVTSEASQLRGDEVSELRLRYDKLCAALARTVGNDPVAAEYLVADLESLTHRLLAARLMQQSPTSADGAARIEPLGPSATAVAPASGDHIAPSSADPPRSSPTGEVVAFRVKVKGINDDKPAQLAVPAPWHDDAGARPDAEIATASAIDPVTVVQPALSPEVLELLRTAVVAKAAELAELADEFEAQCMQLRRLGRQLRQGNDVEGLANQVDALQAAAMRHANKLLAMVTAMHRMAKPTIGR